MKRKRALVDVDGVLADFHTPALEVVEKLSGRKYRTEEFTTWDMFDLIPREYEAACFEVYNEPGFCSTFKPFPGAIEAIAELEEHMDVYIVTSPMYGPTWVHDRARWLTKHFNIPFKKQVHTGAKYLVTGDIFIDDAWKHIESWGEQHLQGMPILWDQPYNRQATEMPRPWIRATGWEHVFGHIERLGL